MPTPAHSYLARYSRLSWWIVVTLWSLSWSTAAGVVEHPRHAGNGDGGSSLAASTESLVASDSHVESDSDGHAVADGEPVRDRIWLLSTRGATANVCRADLESPPIRAYRIDGCGRSASAALSDYVSERGPGRVTVIYVHGNRMSAREAIRRGLLIYRQVARRCSGRPPVDWVIWSWPSEKEAFIIPDARIKARRADTQGLYLAWLLRTHTEANQPTALIGYSFGARVISGSLHALAGGSLRGRTLPGRTVRGARFDVGMIAPAIGSDWLSPRGNHRLATQNLDRLSLLYNRRDAVLRNYWRISRARSNAALGYTGPTSFAPRPDGSPLPVRSRNCGPVVGFRHSEVDYYQPPCYAGPEMAKLIRTSLYHDE